MPKFASWNIEKGGYATYANEAPTHPKKEAQITNGLRALADKGVDSFTLLDVNRWNDIYTNEAGIAERVGTQRAFHVLLDDARLNATHGEGIGIVFATNQTVARHETLDLGTRNALGIIMDIGKHGLQLANIYLDDISEDDRLKQFRALQSQIEPDIPTVLVGDFNGLRRNLVNSSGVHRLANTAMSILNVVPGDNELVTTIQQMNRRLVIPEILATGYIDGDALHQRPTAPTKLPVFGVDYVFHSPSVSLNSFNVPHDDIYMGASDHYPIVYSVEA